MSAAKELVRFFDFMGKLPIPFSLYQFVRAHGVPMPGKKLPKGQKRLKEKECFKNAAQLALDGALIYCEGYAMRPELIPVHHAWCINRQRRVVDPTWDNPEECAYYGIAFQADAIYEMLLETEHLGSMLDDFRRGWPVIRGKMDESEWKHPIMENLKSGCTCRPCPKDRDGMFWREDEELACERRAGRKVKHL